MTTELTAIRKKLEKKLKEERYIHKSEAKRS